jgi:hypothetical protein
MLANEVRRHVGAALLILVVFLVEGSVAQQPGRAADSRRAADVGGIVLDAITEAPVAGAIVTTSTDRGRVSFRTGRNGRFVFTDVSAAAEWFGVAKSGYFSASIEAAEPASPKSQGSTLVIRIRPSATISGVVTDLSGLPAPGVTVQAMLASRAAPVASDAGAAVSTDSGGRYAIGGLEAGEYSVAAADASRAETAAGIVAGISVSVGAGQDHAGVDLRINRTAVSRAPHGCTISGRLLDEYGDAQSGTVSAISPVSEGVNRESRGYTAQSDVKGRYCLAGLPPGEYIVRGSANLPSGSLRAVTEAGQVQTITLPAAFYPDATRSDRAQRIAVADAATTSGIDLVLRAARTTTVSVAVRSASAAAPNLSISPIDDRYGLETTLSPVGDRFQASNIVAGRYRVVAWTTSVLGALFLGSEDIESDGVTPIVRTIVIGPLPRVLGRVEFDGTTVRPHVPQIWLEATAPLAAPAPKWGAVSIDPNGNLTVEGLRPGEYVIHAADDKDEVLRHWSLAAATLNGRDVLDLPIEVPERQDVTGLVLTLTDRIAELSGTLRDEGGQAVSPATVIVFSADRRYWRAGSRRVRLVGLDRAGGYLVRDLPPGDYRVAVTTSGASADPDALAQLEPFAVSVTLAAGDRKMLDLLARGPAAGR